MAAPPQSGNRCSMFFRPHVFLTPIGLTHVPVMPPIPLPPKP